MKMPRQVANSRRKPGFITKEEALQEQIRRHEMIAQEAYLRAEQRGFQGGDSVLDWLEAENDLDHSLHLNT